MVWACFLYESFSDCGAARIPSQGCGLGFRVFVSRGFRAVGFRV